MAVLKTGSKGDDVKKLQSALMDAGYDVGSSGADGVYGAKTAAAVTAYQKANGLTADGIAGSQTTGSLYGGSNSKATETGNVATAAAEPIPPKGISQNIWDMMNSTHSPSDEQVQAQKKAEGYLTNYEKVAGNQNIISDNTRYTMNSSFSKPTAVLQADRYLSEQLAKIQSGRTSYTDRVEAMIAEIENRDKFSYDAETDPLFQQALAGAMKSGKTAMEDTIGQASALTGGYGSTYATAAGNQAYNALIEDAYNNLPEYYQTALNAYQAEGQDMYQKLAMLSDADTQEYQRMVAAFDATSQNRSLMYNDAYNEYRDKVNNAFNYANLQLNENSQKVQNALNLYTAMQGLADTKYAREFEEWNAKVNQAMQMGSLQNSDAWAQQNFDYQKERDAVEDSQWERQFAASQARSSGGGGGSRSGSGGGNLKEPTQSQMQGALKAYEEGGMPGLNKYIASLPSNVYGDAAAAYAVELGEKTDAVLENMTYTKTKDTKNWFWGVDNNDVVVGSDGQTYRVDELPKSIRKDLTKLKENESWSKW